MDNQDQFGETLITLTADIVSAHVSNNSVAVSDLPLLISNVHGALSGLGDQPEAPAPRLPRNCAWTAARSICRPGGTGSRPGDTAGAICSGGYLKWAEWISR